MVEFWKGAQLFEVFRRHYGVAAKPLFDEFGLHLTPAQAMLSLVATWLPYYIQWLVMEVLAERLPEFIKIAPI